MPASRPFEVREYLREDGSCPFREWASSLPVTVRARIAARVVRFEGGNLGDSKPLGDGVWEARFAFGPGYRLYFGMLGGRIVLLLAGGDKSTQRKDVTLAKHLWRDYKEANDETQS